jgi:hypothetical protein
LSILPRLPACAVSTSSESSVYKCGKCLRNPDWQVMFDHEPEKAVATRRRVYDMASADRLLVSGHHFPFPGLGYIEKAGSGYRLIPAAWNPVI